MSEQAESSAGTIGESARQIREGISPARVEERLEGSVSDRPLVRHLLNLRLVATAVAIAAVLALVVSLLLSPKLGALVLLVVFFGGWYLLAQRHYRRRRPTQERGSDDG